MLELLACAACGGDLRKDGDRLACTRCEATYAVRDGIPDLRMRGDERTETVRDFYTAAPFPGYPPRDSLGSLRARAGRSEFARLLDRAIPGDARIVEVGCGTGQMSLYLATADRLVVGADLTRASLELGAAAARRFGVDRALFVETDLRRAGLREGAFDVVYSSGVLHHTPDPRSSFAALTRLARPGGIVVLGLYNAWARIPHRLRRAVGRLSRFRFVPLDPVLRDRAGEPARREAWLRDQYMHPEEHRHTTREVQQWFRESGVEYLRTYPDSLLAAEPLEGDALFAPAEDDWGLENWVAQLRWMKTLAHEGGLWVTIGRKSS
ncbi:MAG TPA: class I SAM-dependent methyltransferase [Polyangiaceae bacterium]|jgi:SAM-dependent methyltransferase